MSHLPQVQVQVLRGGVFPPWQSPVLESKQVR